MSNQERTTLADVINYKPEQYLSDEEVALIQSTFKDNPKLIKVLRKVLVPTIHDIDLPIEEFGKDMFTAGVQYSQMQKEEIPIRAIARQDALKFIIGGLISLKQIANITEESPQAKALRLKKDSNK